MLASFTAHDRDHVAGVRDPGNGVEQGRVDPTEDRAVGSNAQRQGDDCECRESWILDELAQRETQILQYGTHGWPPNHKRLSALGCARSRPILDVIKPQSGSMHL